MSKQTKLPLQYQYQNNVVRFTNQLTSTITLYQITNEQFFQDIIDLRNNKNSPNVRANFIMKYSNLFDGSTAKFGKKAFSDKSLSVDKKTEKAINSFLGSVRRNANTNQYSKLQNPTFVKFNQDLRFNVISKASITKKVKKAKSTTYSRTTIYSKKEKMYKSSIGYIGFAEKEIKGLKQAWQIDFIIKNNLIARQEVLLRCNYDLYYYSKKDKKYHIFDSNIWITLSSDFSQQKLLIELYYDVLAKLKDLVNKLEQSKLKFEPIRVCTYVIRKGGI